MVQQPEYLSERLTHTQLKLCQSEETSINFLFIVVQDDNAKGLM